MTGLDKLEKEIYDTYHDKKNKEILPIVIFLSIIFLLFKGGFVLELLLWGWYYYYCKENNERLNNNKRNVERRKMLIGLREKVLRGEVEFKNKY